MWNMHWVGSTAVPNCKLLVTVCRARTNSTFAFAHSQNYLSSHLAELASYTRAILACKLGHEHYQSVTIDTQNIYKSVFLVKWNCCVKQRCVTHNCAACCVGQLLKQTTSFINLLIHESVILVMCINCLFVSNSCTLYIIYCTLYIVYCCVSTTWNW